MGKLTLVLIAICAGILALSNNVYAIGSPSGIAAGDSSREQYVNLMVGLARGGSGHVTISGQDNLVMRSRPNAGSETLHVGDLNEVITIRGNWGREPRFSRSALPPSPITVPDGGATMIMLGAALAILYVLQRHSTRHVS